MRWSICALGVLAAAALSMGAATPQPVSRPPATRPAASFGSIASLELAIHHLIATYGDRYARGPDYLRRLGQLKQAAGGGAEGIAALEALRVEALLDNPLLNFDRLLLVRRAVGGRGGNMGLPQNWQGNCVLPKSGFDNEIAVLSPVRPNGRITTLYKPDRPVFVGDVDLHFDGQKMLYSSIGANGRWQIFEIGTDGKLARQVTRGDQPDVDNYDACYLPSEKIVFGSTACMQGVPCVGGSNQVVNLYLMNADGSAVRQLCFDQDQNWCPTVMNDGRVMFTRWEYSDTPHYFTRILFRMNPDGIGQMALYGSNSYWPNSIFYARPVPNHPSKVVGIVSGHHGVPRMGELVIFDPAKAQHEADGAIQRIPGHGRKVEAPIVDGLVNGSWPKFLHPYPLSSEFILVSCQPTAQSNWGIYLVDTFDNMVCLTEQPGAAMLEPIPLRATRRPPILPDKVRPGATEATVYVNDVYRGPGLKGVPRGTIKSLRVFAFHYGYQHLANHTYIGIDGPWDVHRILGTVPVETDGSAAFKVPANTPVAVQPLDSEGRALQVMRSWYTAMPGEAISCVGCHEREAESPPTSPNLASRKRPSALDPWLGPARGFSFKRDVQGVLDHYCVSCHDGQASPQRKKTLDLRPGKTGSFTSAYAALHPYVRRPGPESDYHMMPPAEYAANTSELIQMLKKGHHGVQLHPEAWERLYAWIDLNIPDHGTWGEFRAVPNNQCERRNQLRKLYAGLDENPEAIPTTLPSPAFASSPRPAPLKDKPPPAAIPTLDGWPLSLADAARLQQSAASGKPAERSVDLGGVTLQMTLVPAGRFVMGSADGHPDERPASVVAIDKPFWIGRFEVTNQQFALFDPRHDSRYISIYGKDQSVRGIAANGSTQPVIRVSWVKALEFCQWLSRQTGQRFTLPTEAQWEYACRAGAATAMHFGPLGTDYSKLANMADASLNLRANWHLKDPSVNDGQNISAPVGRYPANAWGLFDMHGNVAEWTRSQYKPYPYRADDGREMDGEGLRAVADRPGDQWPQMVVRGGSWYDRAFRCTSSFRLSYPAWQGVYNVGFRVVCEAP
jgi:formylglycine-generating enzyme required for sulfatase activity